MNKIKEVLKVISIITTGAFSPYLLTYVLNVIGIEASVDIVSAWIVILLGILVIVYNWIELKRERRMNKTVSEFNSYLMENATKKDKRIDEQREIIFNQDKRIRELHTMYFENLSEFKMYLEKQEKTEGINGEYTVVIGDKNKKIEKLS